MTIFLSGVQLWYVLEKSDMQDKLLHTSLHWFRHMRQNVSPFFWYLVVEHNHVEILFIKGLCRADLTGHGHPSRVGRKIKWQCPVKPALIDLILDHIFFIIVEASRWFTQSYEHHTANNCKCILPHMFRSVLDRCVKCVLKSIVKSSIHWTLQMKQNPIIYLWVCWFLAKL